MGGGADGVKGMAENTVVAKAIIKSNFILLANLEVIGF